MKANELREVKRNQVSKFLELGFNEQLGMSKRMYKESIPLPRWDRQAADLGFDQLLLIDPQVSLRHHIDVLDNVSCLYLYDYIPYKTANTGPYPFWIQFRVQSNKTERDIREIRSSLEPFESGLSIRLGIALTIIYPKILWNYRMIIMFGCYRTNNTFMSSPEQYIPFIALRGNNYEMHGLSSEVKVYPNEAIISYKKQFEKR